MSQAQNAKKLTENAAAEEKVKVEVMGSYGTNGNLELSKLVENLGHVGTVTKATFPVEVTVDGKSFTINDTGLVEQSGPRINTSNLKVTTVADKETEVTTTSTNKPKEGTPLEISFDVSISEGTITAVDKGTLIDRKVTYDTDGTETEVTFTFALSGVDNSTPNKVTINNLNSYYKITLYGKQIQLNEGNSIVVKGSNTIDDNWKLFYIDDDDNNTNTTEYVHLIYGDYYPANVQTEITSGTNSTIFAPAYSSTTRTDEEKYYLVNSNTSRLVLLRYLKNNSSYSESMLDNCMPTGNYKSWTDLMSALKKNNMVLKDINIMVQGAPNLTMWVNSWNEQGYSTIGIKKNTGGYSIEPVGEWDYCEYTQDAKLYFGNTQGGSDALYFPRKGLAGRCWGNWFASPSSYSNKHLCFAMCIGMIGSYGAPTIGNTYNYDAYCARPVISIPKEDFIRLFPSISIEKVIN